MRQRPATFTSLSLMLTGVVIGCVYTLVQTGQGLFSGENLALITILGVGGMFVSGAALGTLKPRPWGYLCLLLTVLFISAVDIYTIVQSKSITAFYLPDLILVLAGTFLLSQRDSRRIFFDASVRWWERAKRYALGITATGESDRISHSKIRIIDMSESGCLVHSDYGYSLGDKIQLKLSEDFFIPTTVVRQQTNQQFGLKFEMKTWKQKRRLKKFLNRSTRNFREISRPDDTLSKAA